MTPDSGAHEQQSHRLLARRSLAPTFNLIHKFVNSVLPNDAVARHRVVTPLLIRLRERYPPVMNVRRNNEPGVSSAVSGPFNFVN